VEEDRKLLVLMLMLMLLTLLLMLRGGLVKLVVSEGDRGRGGSTRRRTRRLLCGCVQGS
jgi:hypothetical protein